jgi:hypothetical protein
MILLDHLLIQEQVLGASFACDLRQCKGACCTMKGGAGAPLLEGEVEPLSAAISTSLEFLPDRSRAWLEENDPVEGSPGDLSVACLDEADCVFVYYESDVAKCALERAWLSGTSSFRKPLSCHLFPIRVANFGGPYLHYEKIDECEPGRALGAELGLPMVESLREALVRAYGEDLYKRIVAAAKGQDGGDA